MFIYVNPTRVVRLIDYTSTLVLHNFRFHNYSLQNKIINFHVISY